MRTIHSYPIDPKDINQGPFMIEMPIGAQPLAISIHSSILFIDADITVSETYTKKTFQIFKAWDSLPDKPIRYVNTCITPAGYVWHLYEHIN